MVDDAAKGGSASQPDPWDELVSGEDGEAGSPFSFDLDDAAVPAGSATEPGAAGTGGDSAVEAAGDGEPLGDELVNSWLDDPEPAAAPPAADHHAGLVAGQAADAADDAASSELDAWGDAVPVDTSQGADAESSGDTFGLGDADALQAAGSSAEGMSFEPSAAGDFAAGALAGAAAATAVMTKGPPRRAAGAKKGGLGQMIGVVLGGVMAIPITLGILIWGFQKDPFKVTKYVPEDVAFLLPDKFQSGAKKPAGSGPVGGGRGSPLDALGAATSSGSEAAVPDGDLVPDVPLPQLGDRNSDDPVVVDVPGDPVEGETFVDPLAAAVKPAAPAPFDAAAAAAEAAAAAAAAARADRRPLEAAVERALEAVAALDDVPDVTDPVRKKLLVDLYKTLATVGAELAMLERISADAGRPLAAAPQALDGLHDRLTAHRAELVRLGRNWLAFARRPSDGIVLPVTFRSARRIGPFWSSRVTLALANEEEKELVVLSRSEPEAIVGDELLLTGMVFDGEVIWAADIRQARADRDRAGAAGPAGFGF